VDFPLTKDEGGHDLGHLPDELKFVKFSLITWSLDSKGFFYQVNTVFLLPVTLIKSHPAVLSAIRIAPVPLKTTTQFRPEKTLTPSYTITGSIRLNVRKDYMNFSSKCSLTAFLGNVILVYWDKENPNWMFMLYLTQDGKYMSSKIAPE
jgi:hypothetical protein